MFVQFATPAIPSCCNGRRGRVGTDDVDEDDAMDEDEGADVDDDGSGRVEFFKPSPAPNIADRKYILAIPCDRVEAGPALGTQKGTNRLHR